MRPRTLSTGVCSRAVCVIVTLEASYRLQSGDDVSQAAGGHNQVGSAD